MPSSPSCSRARTRPGARPTRRARSSPRSRRGATMKSVRLLSTSLVLGAAVAACATTPPPKELVEARAAYEHAAASPASELNPAQLHDAKVALDRAETAYKADANAPETADFGYVAARKAEAAEAQAGIAKLNH